MIYLAGIAFVLVDIFVSYTALRWVHDDVKIPLFDFICGTLLGLIIAYIVAQIIVHIP